MNLGYSKTVAMAQVGKLTMRIGIGLVLALLLCGLASGGVEAGKKNSFKHKMSPGLTANEFADICDDNGASDIKVTTNNSGGKTVTCSWGDDLTTSCNFATRTCTDTFRTVPENGGPASGVDGLSVASGPAASDSIVVPGAESQTEPNVAPEPIATVTSGAKPSARSVTAPMTSLVADEEQR